MMLNELVHRCGLAVAAGVTATGMLAAIGCEDTGTEPAGTEGAIGTETQTEPVLYAPEGTRSPAAGNTELSTNAPITLSSDAPSEVRAGEEFTYALQVSNTSENPVHNVVVRDVGADTTRFMNTGSSGQGQQRTSQQQGQQQSPQQARSQQQQNQQQTAQTWRVGSLNPGETKTVQVVGYAPEQGQLQSCITVDYSPALCQNIEVVKPSLELAANVEQPGDCACREIAVVYQVRNSGDAAAENVVLNERLPDFLAGPSGEQQVRIDLGNIPAGETVERRVQLIANGTGEFRSQAVAESSSGRVRARASDPILVGMPDLDVAIDGPQTQYVGRDVTYTVTVRNPGDVPVCDTMLRIDGLDTDQRVSYGTQFPREGNVIEIGQIDPGQVIRFGVTAIEVGQPTELQLTAAAEGLCVLEPAQAQIATSIEGIPALRLEAIDVRDPVAVGNQTMYDIQVKNQGTAAAQNVNLVGQLPSEMQFIRGGGATDVNSQGQDIQFGVINSLQPGDVVNWKILVQAQEAGETHLQLRLTSDTTQAVIEQEPTTLFASQDPSMNGQQGGQQGAIGGQGQQQAPRIAED